MRLHRLWLVVLCWLAVPAQASAHYLFIRVLPPAEGGRAAEVYFSELAQAGDPRFIEKVATTKLWIETKAGTFEPLPAKKGSDRLRAHLPAQGALRVAGVWDYGVLARAGQTPFLLRHYPQAVDGTADELNALAPRADCPLQIVARFNNSQIELTVYLDGEPKSGAVLRTIDKELSNEELTADESGRAVWSPAEPGNYSVSVEHVRRESGEAGGKSYSEIREFATLNFNWPLVRTQPDSQAVELFQEALAARARWEEFPGFTARLTASIAGRTLDGRVRVAADGTVNLETDDDDTQTWVQDQLESIVMHRRASERPADVSPRLWFADDDGHPLGRLLIFDGGQFASSYRVKDRQITVVNRNLGSEDMTITVLANTVNADKQFLPHAYTVHYWDSISGELNRTESIVDAWQRIDRWDLPSSHTVTTSSSLGVEVRSFSLSEHALRPERPEAGGGRPEDGRADEEPH